MLKKNAPTGHHVYVYRDIKGKIRYVGYGRKIDRATSRNRSAAMLAFLAQGKYTLEMAGPYGSKEAGIAVETALIAMVRPDLNSRKAPGPTHLQFRPLGVPETFSKRLAAPQLSKADLIAKELACPMLFVRIGNLNFEGDDPRRGYSLDKPPSDPEILARMDRWWQLGRHVNIWKTSPQLSPKILVGVTGPPAHRIIIGAVAIDQKGWRTAEPIKGKLYKIPTLARPNLDAHKLRGRLLSPDIDIKFGSIMSQFFVILECDGQIVGGQQ